jgi:transcription elongation factor Elf1
MSSTRPQKPVAPSGMELIFFYSCPHCGHQASLLAPTRAAMVRCDSCAKHFPIMPVDERGIRFVRIMLAEGRAALDPDFI